MKVVNLIAENFKKLKAVNISPENNVVLISGENGAGKTSVLDAIWAAVGGAEMTKSTGTTMPIRNGQEKAIVRIDLGDIIVIRKWSAAGSTLIVENKEGAVFKSPQSVLDGLIGRIAFDPLAFSNMTDSAQRETLLGLVKLDIDLDKLSSERKALYDRRSEVNRDAKNLSARVDSLPKYVPGFDEEIPVSSVMSEIEKAQNEIIQNRERRNAASRFAFNVQLAKQKRDGVLEVIAMKRKELEDAETDLHLIEVSIQNLSNDAATMKSEADQLVDPDIENIKKKIGEIEASNQTVRNNKSSSRVVLEYESAIAKSEQLSALINDLDRKKDTALKAAKFPIDGLGFSDTGVTFNGIPFSQCSAAERLRTSIAMAMAMNPRLKVLRITDGSLIDKKNMAIIESMVKANDYQCWIETVDESGKVGIYIEDGEVVTEPVDTTV